MILAFGAGVVVGALLGGVVLLFWTNPFGSM